MDTWPAIPAQTQTAALSGEPKLKNTGNRIFSLLLCFYVEKKKKKILQQTKPISCAIVEAPLRFFNASSSLRRLHVSVNLILPSNVLFHMCDLISVPLFWLYPFLVASNKAMAYSSTASWNPSTNMFICNERFFSLSILWICCCPMTPGSTKDSFLSRGIGIVHLRFPWKIQTTCWSPKKLKSTMMLSEGS